MYLLCRMLKQISHRDLNNLRKKQTTMVVVIRRGMMSRVQTHKGTKQTVGNNRANKRLILKMDIFMCVHVEARPQTATVLQREYSFLNPLGS